MKMQLQTMPVLGSTQTKTRLEKWKIVPKGCILEYPHIGP